MSTGDSRKSRSDDGEAAIGRTRAAYDRIAAACAARNTGPLVPEVAAFVDRFVDRLPLSAAVLDLGCGPAHLTARLRERGLRAIGGDLSIGMLVEARRFTDGPLV